MKHLMKSLDVTVAPWTSELFYPDYTWSVMMGPSTVSCCLNLKRLQNKSTISYMWWHEVRWWYRWWWRWRSECFSLHTCIWITVIHVHEGSFIRWIMSMKANMYIKIPEVIWFGSCLVSATFKGRRNYETSWADVETQQRQILFNSNTVCNIMRGHSCSDSNIIQITIFNKKPFLLMFALLVFNIIYLIVINCGSELFYLFIYLFLICNFVLKGVT